jgi:hypothetical protein
MSFEVVDGVGAWRWAFRGRSSPADVELRRICGLAGRGLRRVRVGGSGGPSVEVLRMPASVSFLEWMAVWSLREGGDCRDGGESRKRLWMGGIKVVSKVW